MEVAATRIYIEVHSLVCGAFPFHLEKRLTSVSYIPTMDEVVLARATIKISPTRRPFQLNKRKKDVRDGEEVTHGTKSTKTNEVDNIHS